MILLTALRSLDRFNICTSAELELQYASIPAHQRHYRFAHSTVLPVAGRSLTNIIAGCEEAMYALEQCHARGWLVRITGGCNDAKTAVNRCLRQARLEKTKENHEKSKARNAALRSAWAEIDANSWYPDEKNGRKDMVEPQDHHLVTWKLYYTQSIVGVMAIHRAWSSQATKFWCIFQLENNRRIGLQINRYTTLIQGI